jgi:hypothetical protein
MHAIRLAVALVLLAAPWARAQRVRVAVPFAGAGQTIVVPQTPMAGLSAPALIMPASSLAPALAAPSPLASPVPFTVIAAPAAAASRAAAPLKLSAVHAAIAEFSKIDLRSAPAAEARDGADALMARALGAEFAGTPALTVGALSVPEIALRPFEARPAREPASGPRVHLLSKPLHATVELGPAARFVYYALEAVFAIVKAALTWHATGSPAAVAAMLVFDVLKAPGSLTAESLADLNLRYWWRKLSTLKRLADTPGVTRIRVLTTGQARFSGMLARSKENTGLVFMDSTGPLPGTIAEFGAPIPVGDLAGRSARLVMKYDGVEDATVWTPALDDLLSGTPIPAEVAAAWRARLEAENKGRSPLRRLFDFRKDKELVVEGFLSDGAGGESALGTIAFGRSVKRLVGLGRLDRIGALFGRRPAPRAIPMSDTVVERDGERTVRGLFLRLWRRLTGALIVR